MFLLYKGQTILEEELRLPLTNRAFQYNDGFFETIILKEGKIRFWPEHLERIKEAGEVLGLELPALLFSDQFSKMVQKLAQENNTGALARVKLKIWRAGEGLYSPQTDETNWLVTAQAATVPATTPFKVGICQKVRTIPSPFSSFKGFNSPVYVMASREKVYRSLDDLLLLDPAGNLAELTFSNLFWIKDQTLFTPALETGCLNGVLRRRLLRWAIQNNWEVKEDQFKPEVLKSAELVFAGNVTGLRMIEAVEGERTGTSFSVLNRIQEELGF
ncbi:aminotransferase class IV [Rufibacter roseolus]|uniref:aminotransferase class IV n=1 Tax=Rufibacter roseolus TaxID=2817375 RepID=UPI001B30A58B|nr:aminotransferase class IV [Rufibacter roseolus]